MGDNISTLKDLTLRVSRLPNPIPCSPVHVPSSSSATSLIAAEVAFTFVRVKSNRSVWFGSTKKKLSVRFDKNIVGPNS